ncbi:sarcosine oxidase subunit gamma family protein [Pararhizobium sp.]|uniref:sarcosine oxidase subunit gamma family protein n=1 Tax=Pararhizobium sp. TaxID=1977563 RepID=UPI0027200A66|nr:sarcosine oxidase subunit gamma family protein [Pararhizobium sp.]MDO9416688.1 sarcosine oxidase subunit gamma family protein [Pararhizobium sp.]
MRDFALQSRSPLPDTVPQKPLAKGRTATVSLSFPPQGHVLHVLAARDAGDLTVSLAAISDGSANSVRFAGLGQWFIVGDAPLSAADVAAHASALAGKASIFDQSHGRTRIGISGGDVETVLAKGTAVDLDLSQFPVGRSAITLVGHMSVHLTRTAGDAFELMVLRSFAESLWDDLLRMSAEFR